jgi:hypothetical protein
MNWRIDNLGLHHRWFFDNFQSFVFKNILHVIELRIVYNLMSSLIANMTRILHRSLYSDMLSDDFKNCRNRFFFSFNSTCFNIAICLTIVYALHSCFLYNYLGFMS